VTILSDQSAVSSVFTSHFSTASLSSLTTSLEVMQKKLHRYNFYKVENQTKASRAGSVVEMYHKSWLETKHLIFTIFFRQEVHSTTIQHRT